jgi:hypothetical protein
MVEYASIVFVLTTSSFSFRCSPQPENEAFTASTLSRIPVTPETGEQRHAEPDEAYVFEHLLSVARFLQPAQELAPRFPQPARTRAFDQPAISIYAPHSTLTSRFFRPILELAPTMWSVQVYVRPFPKNIRFSEIVEFVMSFGADSVTPHSAESLVATFKDLRAARKMIEDGDVRLYGHKLFVDYIHPTAEGIKSKSPQYPGNSMPCTDRPSPRVPHFLRGRSPPVSPTPTSIQSTWRYLGGIYTMCRSQV